VDPTLPHPSVEAVVQTASALPGLAATELGAEGLLVTWGPQTLVTDPADWRATIRGMLCPGGSASSGGVVGWIGYEAGCVVERQAVHPPDGSFPTVALWRWSAGLRLLPNGEWEPIGSGAGREEARQLLARASSHEHLPAGRLDVEAPAPPTGQASAYRSAVRAALDHITRGDVYQVCLAWAQDVAGPMDAVGAWLALRRNNPAERGALLRLGDRWLLSNSPETFVDVRLAPDGLEVVSLPIKGTAPAASGEVARRWLLESEKERAELTMIVDLVRNDLGRVARPGTVHTGERTVRRCGDLWHAEQRVSARLRPDCDAVDAIAAAFPPGSVTGAPKVRAMQVIRDLEPGPRGPYTGALGIWFDDGSARTSVLIRAAQLAPEGARYHVGAGIVADSDPDHEWRETCAKGNALGAALARAVLR